MAAIVWILIRKEFTWHLRSRRMLAALACTAFLASTTALTGSMDYSRNYAAYVEQRRLAEEDFAGISVYANLSRRLVFPPQPLSILSRGVMQTKAREYLVTLGGINIYAPALLVNYDSQFMKTLVQIDFATVVSLLLSFLAVVMASDAICGERQRGTITLLLAAPVRPWQVVVGKAAGGALALAVPFAGGLTISLAVMVANPQVTLTTTEWLRVAAYAGVSALFLGQVYTLGLAVSALVRSPERALILCLYAWLASALVGLSVAPSLARYGLPALPNQTYMDRRQELWNQHNAAMEAWRRENPPPASPLPLGLPRNGVRRYGTPAGYRWLRGHEAHAAALRLPLEQRLYELRWSSWAPLARQAELADRWALVSPVASYQVLSQSLARTTLADLFHLSAAGRAYRDTLIQYLQARDAFASRRWFTDDPVDQEPLFPDSLSVPAGVALQSTELWRQRMAWVETQDRRAAADPRRRLDLSDLPPFAGRRQRSLAAATRSMLPSLAVLLMTTAAGLAVAVFAFRAPGANEVT